MKDFQIKKLYYSISEVGKMLTLEPYVLRYWETEFEQLKPQKNRAGNRVYTAKDIEIIKLIQKLTREDRYTISGARQVLSSMEFDETPMVAVDIEEAINIDDDASENGLLTDLQALRALLVDIRSRVDPDSDLTQK